ncbi:MAG: tetratricopeptide repeat protein [Planctomycetes bacterium]|nr:tetratricopeptide repeat protein [Planctomycetota bacterium]
MSKTGMVLMVLMMWVVAGTNPAMAASRKVKPGETAPEFSVKDLSGDTYAYTGQSKAVLMVVFLSARQESSFKAQDDLVRILGDLSDSNQVMDLVIALDDPNAFSALTGLKGGVCGQMTVIRDEDHHLWGQFGAIAMPTVVLMSAQRQVVCFEAGYGFNFARVVRSHLRQVLGAEVDVTQTAMNQVGTVSNNTQKAKLARLINAARLMAARGHVEVAVLEMKKAQALDPNGIDTRVAVAKLYCEISKGKEALETLDGVIGQTHSQKGQVDMVAGWAYRLTGQMDAALKALLRATEQTPGEALAFYELGRVCEAKGLKDDALAAYRRALALLL